LLYSSAYICAVFAGSIVFIIISPYLRNVNKIKATIWRSYFSFFQGVKSENIRIFKDFYNAEKMKKNKSDGGLYFVIVP